MVLAARWLISHQDGCVCRPAIVGLTDQYIHERTSKEHYRAWYAELKDKVQTVDVNNSNESTVRDEEGDAIEKPNTSARIKPADDYRWGSISEKHGPEMALRAIVPTF